MISRYGFIVKADSYNHEQDSAALNSPEFFTEVVGVSSDEEAIVVAKGMIENGIQVIELCGGFGLESAEYIISSVDSEIPIGYVTFSDTENLKLKQVLSAEPGV